MQFKCLDSLKRLLLVDFWASIIKQYCFRKE
jgi:hypothetical protein